ncbi:hypothetical protein JCM10207_005557 [Rhodosporidiobolus poonsookiae]
MSSPRPPHSALRPPASRADSNPPSPRISPTTPAPFSFPQSQPSYPTSSSSFSAAPPAQPLSASSSFSRFNAAFAAYPSAATRRASTSHASISSVASDASLRGLAHAHALSGGGGEVDPLSPLGSGSGGGFDALQRELGADGGRGLGLMQDETPGGRAPSREMGRLYEEPEEYDTLRGLPNGRTRAGQGEEDDYLPPRSASALARRNGSVSRGGEEGAHPYAVSGRRGSVDAALAAAAAAGGSGGDSMAFLLSPPPSGSFDPSSSGGASAKPSSASSKERERAAARDRIFPAPLLLKGDRSFSFSNGTNGTPGPPAADPASPAFPPTAPLSIPRRPSATASAIAAAAAGPSGSPGQQYQRGWSRAEREREGPMNPPESTARSSLPYHRRQQSSTSSLSHGSYLPYNNTYAYEPRHQNSASTSTATSVTTSPAVGSGRNTQAFPTPASATAPLPAVSAPAPSSTSAAPAAAADPPISAQALLLHVLSLRSAASPMALSQSQGPLSRAPTPLSSAHHQRIRSASSTTSAEPDHAPPPQDRSPSRAVGVSLPRLDTVDLSHKRIADVPPEVVDELAGEVEKLALGYNLLKDLPMHFAALGGRLKYLNVRVNMLTVFPAVLCEMPSIEILDISRNKIRKLPSNPGTLVNLKVFSIAKNRIKRLPVWFTSMSHLKVLKLDHNPLEWPPKELTAFPSPAAAAAGTPMSKQEEADEMQRWLPALVRWMRENREREVERERAREGERRRRPSVAVEHVSEDEKADDRRAGSMTRTESGRLPDSTSTSTTMPLPIPRNRSDTALASLDHDAAAETDGASPSDASAEADTRADPSARHSRNASSSATQSLAPTPRPALRAKKSLPDLRQSHADILAQRRTGTTLEDEPPRPVVPALEGPLRRFKDERPAGLVHSASAKAALPTQNSAPASSAPSPGVAAPPAAGEIVRSQSARPVPTASTTPPATQTRQGTAPLPPRQQSTRPKLELEGAVKPRRGDERAAPGDFDRDSGAYFRRLSMLPASTISKTIPVALLSFADAIRGILFSLSQIYSALRQFVVFASQDRLPAPVARLMGGADAQLASLINALDRFDSLSRRGTPPPPIVRDVFRACRDNVGLFGRLVAALQPQLQALTASADARYTRTLLLALYGAMGEIAVSWSAVAPLLAASDDPNLATLVLQPPTPSPQLEMSSAPTGSGSGSGSSSSGGGGGGGGSGSRLTRQRSTTRRHAGSFSVEDVQLGAVLPPAEIPPVPALPPGPLAMEDGGLSISSLAGVAPSAMGESASTAATLRARPPLSAKSSASSAVSASSAGSSSSSRAPPPGALSMPPQLGYEEMAQKAFEHPLTPGVQGLFNAAGAGAAAGVESRSASRAGSFSQPTNPLAMSSSVAALATAAPPASSAAPPPVQQAVHRAHRESRPVSTLNADETFIDQAESTIAIAADVYGMLLDAFDDPALGLAGQFAQLAGGRRRLKELTQLCQAGQGLTSRLAGAVERVRGSDGRGRLKFGAEDANEVGSAAFEYVQNVIRTAKLMKSVSQELAFPQQLKDAVGQLTLGTREFARLLSHAHTSFRPQQVGRSAAPPAAAAVAPPTGGGGGEGEAARGRSAEGAGRGEEREVRTRDFA